MGVFTFVCRCSDEEWTAKQLNGELESSAGSTYDLQRKLVQAALSADSSGAVQSSFSYVTPSSAVFQVSLFIEFFVFWIYIYLLSSCLGIIIVFWSNVERYNNCCKACNIGVFSFGFRIYHAGIIVLYLRCFTTISCVVKIRIFIILV